MLTLKKVITNGGYREPVSLQQIRTFLEMESHEEKLHNMIKISKIENARDQAKDAARQIKERQREQQKSGMAGIGSSGISSSDSNNFPPSSSNNTFERSKDFNHGEMHDMTCCR